MYFEMLSALLQTTWQKMLHVLQQVHWTIVSALLYDVLSQVHQFQKLICKDRVVKADEISLGSH